MTSRRHPARWARVLQPAGLVAAIVLAALVNVLSARHFARWDWTTSRRWSLAPATVETLRSLAQPVDMWIIGGRDEPFRQSLDPIVYALRAQSSRLDLHWIDPDRDAAQLASLERRFGLETDRAEQGRLVTDAVVVVASGDKHWLVTAQDLAYAHGDEGVKPRAERALTLALRHLLDGTQSKLCFTVGHGELSLEGSRDERDGLAALHDVLVKSNYELASVDATRPNAHEPFEGCAVVVIAGVRAPFGPDEENRLRTYLLDGGSLLATVGPLDGSDEASVWPSGLDAALAPFGIALEDALVQETDSSVTIPDTHGEGFFVSVRPHPVTAGLADAASHPPRVAVFFARALRHIAPPGAVAAADVLLTSDGAFGKRDLTGAAAWDQTPDRASEDLPGPLIVAMAAERPKTRADAPHGGRVVVVGSRFALADDNWRQPRPVHGAAFFVDSAISWLAASPVVVDVPDKPDLMAGMSLSEESRGEVKRYVLGLMPLAALLLAASVWAWRRSSEDKPYERRGRGRAP
ncbi:MAG: Gldg family protein [Polyangiaceae bacterium]